MVDSPLELPGRYDAKKHRHCWHPFHAPEAVKGLVSVDFCCGMALGSCFHIRLCDPGVETEEKNHGFPHPPCGYPSVVERLRLKVRECAWCHEEKGAVKIDHDRDETFYFCSMEHWDAWSCAP